MTVFVKIPATNASEARQHYRRELARLKRLPRGDPKRRDKSALRNPTKREFWGGFVVA